MVSVFLYRVLLVGYLFSYIWCGIGVLSLFLYGMVLVCYLFSYTVWYWCVISFPILCGIGILPVFLYCVVLGYYPFSYTVWYWDITRFPILCGIGILPVFLYGVVLVWYLFLILYGIGILPVFVLYPVRRVINLFFYTVCSVVVEDKAIFCLLYRLRQGNLILKADGTATVLGSELCMAVVLLEVLSFEEKAECMTSPYNHAMVVSVVFLRFGVQADSVYH